MDPEIFLSQYSGKGYDGEKADLWALACILFIMVFANFPLEMAVK